MCVFYIGALFYYINILNKYLQITIDFLLCCVIIKIVKREQTSERGNKTMTKYTAVFKNGEVVRTSEQFNSRVEFMNWICENRLGKIYGKLIEIRCTVMMA